MGSVPLPRPLGPRIVTIARPRRAAAGPARASVGACKSKIAGCGRPAGARSRAESSRAEPCRGNAYARSRGRSAPLQCAQSWAGCPRCPASLPPRPAAARPKWRPDPRRPARAVRVPRREERARGGPRPPATVRSARPPRGSQCSPRPRRFGPAARPAPLPQTPARLPLDQSVLPRPGLRQLFPAWDRLRPPAELPRART
ncbi:protein FAM229A isoform X1 [Phascolarctos cinereus]|uniref:Protein FAM229A isoform X1 n=1 Tax=Phascolarctos cinereus TaxID=38626 RepID=A0A6P5K230_PHACI|nr:protein FAM229A isoform X1 [Phascolarctos cinereus]